MPVGIIFRVVEVDSKGRVVTDKNSMYLIRLHLRY